MKIKHKKHSKITSRPTIIHKIFEASSSFHAKMDPFLKATLYSTQPQCCLTFSCIDLQMLLRYYLIHISIIMRRQFFYLLYLHPYLDVGLFMSYLCDLFLIFIFIVIVINCIISWIQIHLLFSLFCRMCPIIFGR